jgi:hypothetical protein
MVIDRECSKISYLNSLFGHAWRYTLWKFQRDTVVETLNKKLLPICGSLLESNFNSFVVGGHEAQFHTILAANGKAWRYT